MFILTHVFLFLFRAWRPRFFEHKSFRWLVMVNAYLHSTPISMAFTQNSLHIVLIPLMGPGHIIPMIDMAKCLAKHGGNITIILTHLNASRFRETIQRAVETGLSIRILEIRFPAEQVGLPLGCESVELLSSYTLMKNFLLAIDMLQRPMEEMLKGMKPVPRCIICDKNLTWMAEICARLKIPRIIFDGMSCFTELVMHRLYVSKGHEVVPPAESFVVDGLPDRIELTRLQLPGILNPGPEGADAHERVLKTESSAYGMVVNTFEELEQRYVDDFREVKRGKVWSVGPLSLFSSNHLEDRAHRGSRASIDVENCLEWLDRWDRGSVVYACLGSLNRLPLAQFIELAVGLESSHYPFVLVVTGDRGGEIEKWILDEQFEDRTKEKSLLIRGWSPQMLILSHPSVGGFLTHCGWNSSLEGICAGVPMITWPLFAEQFLNEKLLVQIVETGIGVGARKIAHLGEEQTPENIVRRDAIKTAVERIMDKGEEGRERRKRAMEVAARAKRSVEEGGSSYLNVAQLIQEIGQLGESKKDSE